MKVLFLTEGGNKTGFGHLMRCIALAQGIEKYFSKSAKPGLREESISIQFVVNGDKLAKKIFNRQRRFKIEIKDWVKEYRELESRLRNTDWVIIDSYLATKRVYDFIFKRLNVKEIRETYQRLICLDDNNRIQYPPSIVVNGAVNGEKLNYSVYSSPDKRMYLLGREYVILRNEFWKVPKKHVRKRIKDVLITFGGISHTNFVKKLLQFLLTQFPHFNYHIVASDLQIVSNIRKNVNYYSNLAAEKMRFLMLKCDFSISAGGQTLYELARIGIPTIGICFGKNQVNNLNGFHAEGFLEYVGIYSDNKVFNRIDMAIQSLIPQEVRNKKNIIGRNLIDSKGIERILINLSKLNPVNDTPDGFNVRPVTREDCKDLWLWRNHPDVKKWAFNAGKIEYEKHKDWFEQKFKDRKVKMYIAENKEREKVGQVRFEERASKRAYINVNLNPKFMGKDFGSKIIKTATEFFMKEKSKVREVIAEIIGENIASQKAFQKAGYVFSKEKAKREYRVEEFVFRKKDEIF